MQKIKIVVDTNILISAFVFPSGVIQEIFERIITRDYELGISQEILSEFEEVLFKKFSLNKGKINQIIEFINRNSTLVSHKKRLEVIKDEPDNRILECALEFQANYIISGNRHILSLKKYNKIKILKASDFLKKVL